MSPLRCLFPAVLALALLSSPSQPRADSALPSFLALFPSLDLPEERSEFSHGYDMTGQSWSAYATAVFALGGPAHQDGWRLRLSGLYGNYGYERRAAHVCKVIHQGQPSRNLDKICEQLVDDGPEDLSEGTQAYLDNHGLEVKNGELVAVTPHQATHYAASIAPGYQMSLGALILKGYLGLAYERHDVTPDDSSNDFSGGHWGAQAGLEAWLPMGDKGWLSADGSYFSGTSRYAAMLKLGYRPLSWLSLGPELAAYGHRDDVSGRAGAFVRFKTAGVETTLSGGVSGAYESDPTAYGTANMFVRF